MCGIDVVRENKEEYALILRVYKNWRSQVSEKCNSIPMFTPCGVLADIVSISQVRKTRWNFSRQFSRFHYYERSRPVHFRMSILSKYALNHQSYIGFNEFHGLIETAVDILEGAVVYRSEPINRLIRKPPGIQAALEIGWPRSNNNRS